MTTTYLNRIATAVPEHDVHDAFAIFAEKMLADPRLRTVFRRMVSRADIAHRYSFLDPQKGAGQVSSHDANEFYRLGNFPTTSRRMELFEQSAPVLMRRAVDRLALSEEEHAGITHVLVTCCTGLYAPGLDFEIVEHLGLSAGVERTMVGFMGCYAAINALKLARHIVRSDPKAGVLMLNLELCTLHFQETQELEQVLSFLVFADGAAASLITAREQGFALDSFKAVIVPETRGLITWKIRGLGFDMLLSGQVPSELGRALGFDVVIHGACQVSGLTVSSSKIRELLSGGELRTARALLGHGFFIDSTPARGRGVGTKLTVPTINLAPYQELLPPNGVYVTQMRIDGDRKSTRLNSSHCVTSRMPSSA